MNHDILAFAVMLRGLQAFKREKQQLRRAQRKAVERNKSAAQDADYPSDYRHTGAVSFHI